MLRRFPLLATLLGACTASGDAADDTDGNGSSQGGTPCAYPNAAEPMALNEPLAAYRWPNAIHGDGREAPLDLGFVPCAGSDDIEWSPFDVLLFVSIPAW